MSVSPANAPQFETTTLVVDDVTVVRCVGRLVSGVTEVLKTEVRALLPHTKRVVLDFSAVTYLDSSGLGAVVSLYVSAGRSGCELRLYKLSPRVRELLGVTHLLSALEACGQYMVKLP